MKEIPLSLLKVLFSLLIPSLHYLHAATEMIKALIGPSNQLTDLSGLLFWCVWSGSLNSWLLGSFWPDVGCITMQVFTKMWFKCLVTYLLILLIILLSSLPVGHIMSFKTISYDLYVDVIQLYRSINPNWIMVS